MAHSNALKNCCNASSNIMVSRPKAPFRRCSSRKLLLRISQYSQENTYVEVPLYQKETPPQMFSCESCKIFKSSSFKEHTCKVLITFFRDIKGDVHNIFWGFGKCHKKIWSSFLCNIWNKVLEIDECGTNLRQKRNQKMLYLKKLNE